ncbi:recombinase family protein [Subtercola frigoramans]|uniref:DNA invertase Pin-like site-specific DNA recombinase n=1 Tax=Subtercola frigoramans TaxID=120298 RepID=A0ABS2L652_9MICO|nr:recombinase family protein [Subtercola frigoramans]MBM7472509.1 DNA invertase Pin-like site-specific DNA recombinase [Subtercola frigoramans]
MSAFISGNPSPQLPNELQLPLPGLLDGTDVTMVGVPKGKRAVIYIRVSTQRQVTTDYDPEGNSLPAQRKACYRKAEQLGVTIIDEYVEPGRSATEMTKRLAFQQMLERIRVEKDVDYVIVYKLSRMARNRFDDAIVGADLKKRGVTLISATESIDETPVGQLMHGILAAFNEFRSAEEGADIAYKMGEKAKKGGTLGRAPIGYMNTIDRVDGREIRAVEVDPERAPFVKLAFELYAAGHATLDDIATELTDRGLRTRATQSRPAGPISTSKMFQLLRDRYYLGLVMYQGEEYPGRHEALIDQELFDKVQGLLESRGHAGERRRVVHHYLKGTLWCGRCFRRDGSVRRMIIRRTISRSGDEYFYFFCRGTQDGLCDAKYSNMERVERAVEDHFRTIQFSPEYLETMRAALSEGLSDQEHSQRLLKKQLTDQLDSLDAKESNLLDLAADGTLPQVKIRERLRTIAADRLRLTEQLENLNESLTDASAFVEANLALLEDPHALYMDASDEVRRRLNQAIFRQIFVDHEEVTDHDLEEPLGDLLAAERVYTARRIGLPEDAVNQLAAASWAKHYPKRKRAAQMSGSLTAMSLSLLPVPDHRVLVCSNTHLVGLTGFEPATP